MIQHRLDSGRWERLARDVFRLTGALTTWRQSLMAACLAWGKGSAASHRSAAALWNLAGFELGPIEITVPTRRRCTAPGVIHRCDLAAPDVSTINGIPVTSADRTLLDLASIEKCERVEEALDDALRRKLVSIGRLLWRLEMEASLGRPGIRTLRFLVEARAHGAVPRSVFETRLLRAMKGAGLPAPVRQHKVQCGDRIMFVDFAYPKERIAIEADGYRWHSGRSQWEHDLARRNDLTLLGWRVIHVTWAALDERPQAVLAAVKDALGQQSLAAGLPRPPTRTAQMP